MCQGKALMLVLFLELCVGLFVEHSERFSVGLNLEFDLLGR